MRVWGIFVFFALLILAGNAGAVGDLFDENFDDGSADGFVPDCPLWNISYEGTYHISNSGYEVYCWTIAGDATWSDYTYSLSLKSQFSVNQIIAFRVQENRDCYVLNLRADPWNDAVLTKWKDNILYHLSFVSFPNYNGIWHDLQVSLIGATMQFNVDGQEVFTFTDDEDPFLTGKIGVISYTGGVIQQQILDVDNVRVDSFVVPTTNTTLSSIKALYR